MSPIIGSFSSGSAFGRKGGLPPSNLLYPFTTATFTSGGSTGINGPSLTQARSGLSGPEITSWRDDTSFFNVAGGMQLWTVPGDGIYRIQAMGATAGRTQSHLGGRGIIIRADISLLAGEVLRILVGQGGTSKADDCNTGAGGGTFVVKHVSSGGDLMSSGQRVTPLIIAGGGGGTARTTGLDAVNTRTGGTSSAGTAGGSNGAGGSANQGPSGAGYSGNGAAAQWGSLGGANNGIAQSFLNGGQGGSSTQQTPNVLGGFGCGASGHGNCCIGGGGGGGYGGGGATTSCQAGGGGGSFVVSGATNLASSNGQINGTSVTNLNAWNAYAPSNVSGAFAPAGSVIITLL